MEDEYAMGLTNSYMPVKRPYLIDDADGTEKERINIQILGCITCTILSSQTSKSKASRKISIQKKQLVEEMTKIG